MNVVGLIDCVRHNIGPSFPQGYWTRYAFETAALAMATALCLLGSATFSKASNTLLVILTLSIVTIPVSAAFNVPFHDKNLGVHFTGLSITTFSDNLLPRTNGAHYKGLSTFRGLFGILFP